MTHPDPTNAADARRAAQPDGNDSPHFLDEQLYAAVLKPAKHVMNLLRSGEGGSSWTQAQLGMAEASLIKGVADSNSSGGLEELLIEIHRRPVAARKFAMPGAEISDIASLHTHEVASLAVELAAKVCASASLIDENETSRTLFRQQQKYLLDEDPRVDLIVPILGVAFAAPFSVGTLEIIEFPETMRRQFVDHVEVAARDVECLGAATWALRVSNVSCEPGGYGDYFVASADESSHDMIDRFFQALAIVHHGRASYGQIGFFPRQFSTSLISPDRPFVYLLRDYGSRIDQVGGDLYTASAEETSQISETWSALSSAHPSVNVAARRLVMSYQRDDDEDRIIDLSIALEAILGSGFSETVHRICLRAAMLLAIAGWGDSKTTYSAMKGMYAYRSRVVHGTPGPHKQDLLKVDGVPIHASRFAVAALCSLLRLVLNVEDFDPDKIDEDFIYTSFDAYAQHINGRNDGLPPQGDGPI